jgi:hypothetical protein
MNIKKLAGQDDLVIRQVVLDMAQKKDQIIHGTRALNQQIPTYLKRKTEDYDIFTDNPRKSAREAVRELKRKLGNNFKVVMGRNKGTFKVKRGEKTVVDYTQIRGKIKSKKILGIKYKDLETIKRGTQKLVKKKGAEFRREKDIDTLSRIKQVEKLDNIFNKL